MYEHEDGYRTRASQRPQTQDTPADESDAREQARRALQDAYDWRDDESNASATATSSAATAAPTTTAARAAARRNRREVTRSISRTVGV
ncbi:hypothetical protein [Actinocrinis sp.]|uniref:hypothetical protein n=1 Tax=Actinocrinis sp. TaxID=1920516 RepID=UPI002CA9827C|nr:hypothetical protein [Actinocrinis sp.]HXR70763.1 hypothetical protein [Actinocrinis sp.]